MRIKQYGVTLRRIEKRDIELIRKYRNSESIRNNMLYRKYITKSMQLQWFKSIEKNPKISYYIIIYKRKKIGLINVKKIDKNISESGLFMFNKENYSNYTAVIASVLLIKTGFYVMKTFNEETIIRVIKTNGIAIKYNKSLGYFIIDETNEYYLMKLTLDSYEKATKKILKAINIIYGKSFFELIFEETDIKLGLYDAYKYFYKTIEPLIIKKIEKENYKKYILDI